MVSFAFADWKKDVLESAADRFERRLTEETGMLRVEMARMETRLIAWMFVLWLGNVGALATLLKWAHRRLPIADSRFSLDAYQLSRVSTRMRESVAADTNTSHAILMRSSFSSANGSAVRPGATT